MDFYIKIVCPSEIFLIYKLFLIKKKKKIHTYTINIIKCSITLHNTITFVLFHEIYTSLYDE